MSRIRTLLAALAALTVASGAQAKPVELTGTWFVLIHYKSDLGANSDKWRWLDFIWVFEPEGKKLRWTTYPIVVFEDDSGRFEPVGGHLGRVLEAWEPNEGQRAQIAAGLEVNPRGSKSKPMKGTQTTGWKSRKPRSSGSVNVVSYAEVWSVKNPELPIFQRADFMGSGRTEGLEGITRFTTLAVESGGNILTGEYERDGNQRGRFKLIRSGVVTDVQGKNKTGVQKAAEQFRRQGGARLLDQSPAERQALEERIKAGDVPEELREKVRKQLREGVVATVSASGGDARRMTPQINGMVKRIEKLIFDEGKSIEEVEKLLREGKIPF